MVIGLVLFVVGLIGLLMRHDLAMQIVGRDQAFHEALFGGSSLDDAMLAVTVPAALAMVIGITAASVGLARRMRR